MSVSAEGQQRVPARRPWRPECLPDVMRADVERLRYIVLDEIVGDLVTLSVSPWPYADPQGRVRFDGGPDRAEEPRHGHLLVHRTEIHDLLYDGWLRRGPRVGDVFAAEVDGDVAARLDAGEDVALDEHLRLGAALPGAVCDITMEARNVAKLAFYAGVAGVQPHEQARANDQVHTGGRRAKARMRTVASASWSGPCVPQPRAREQATCRWTVPADRLRDGETGVLDAIRENPGALFYFLLNVGDGDTQLLLLPRSPSTGRRRAVVVDAATTRKLPRVLDQLTDEGVLAPPGGPDEVFALVVATHPHDDHIEGMPELLERYGGAGVADFWEPGYYAPSGAFAEMMSVIEGQGIRHTEPTAGLTRYVDGARITVLAPSVQLRTAYDSYGVDCNDASIVMKVEFPAVRIAARRHRDGTETRADLRLPRPWSLILGADAQTRSWSHVTAEFPQLHRGHNAPLYRGLAEARGRDYLAGDVLKVSHHASKHGINIELIERVRPKVTLISSVGGGGRYGFPHALATQAIAEALDPRARSGAAPRADADLGIHYTGGCTPDGAPLGSLALLVPPKRGAQLVMWRFGDSPRDPVDLTRGRVLHPIRCPE